MQNIPEIKSHYEMLRQPTITYDKNIEQIDAISAIKKYRPRVVIASWVTHVYDDNEPFRGGNILGVDEEWLIKNVDYYIFIGNGHVHRHKKILDIDHKSMYFEWLLSRQLDQKANFIRIWKNINGTHMEN